MSKRKSFTSKPALAGDPIKASASGKSLGLPTLALETVKLVAKPTFSKFAFGLGVLPSLITPPRPSAPNMPAPKVPISAGMNSMQAAQVKTPVQTNVAPQTNGDNDDTKESLVLAASKLAAGFAQAASSVHLSQDNEQKFLDISAKILDSIKQIESTMVDEQDTSIVHAATAPATTIVQQPFLPTEAPVPTSDPLSQLLSTVGLLVVGIGTALAVGSQWLGTMWFGFADKLSQQVKHLFNLGWSRVVTGFNLASTFVTNSVSTIMKWVDVSMATVSNWVSKAAEQIKNLWNAFDFSKLNILDFDLKGLWAKMQDLSIFGEWGQALKRVLGFFGDTGLDALRKVFDTVGKIWNFVKPIFKILGKVVRFLGPIGFLFGLATMADDIVGLVGEAGAILKMDTSEAKITGVKTLIAHALRVIAESILPESLVNAVFNSREEDDAINTAVELGATAPTGNTFGADYKIVNPGKLNDLSINQLRAMVRSGDFSDDDEETMNAIIAAKEARGENPDLIEDVKPEVVKATEVSDTSIPVTVARAEPAAELSQAVKDQSLDQMQRESEMQISQAIRSYAGAQNLDQTNISSVNLAIDKVKMNLISKYVKTSKISAKRFELEFEKMRSRILDQYYYNINKENIQETEREINSSPLIQPTVVATSSTVLSPYAVPGTISVASTTPVALDAKTDGAVTQGNNVQPDPNTQAIAPKASTSRAASAADFTTRTAYYKSTGYCARHVRRGLQAAGYKFQQQAMAYQYVTNGVLQKMGFTQVDMKEAPQKGDISVMGPKKPGHAGHISIFNGRNWVSDFVQRHESPYNGGKPNPGQWMTRWRDTGSPGTFDPSTTVAYNAEMNQPSASYAGPMADTVDLSGVSTGMSDILNQALAMLGLGGLPQAQTDKGASTSNIKPAPDNTNLELDQLLYLNNGFYG